MLDTLKFVQGAIAKNDYIPALTHFYIHNGFIKGYNGQVALCAPIAADLTASPKASDFIKAIQCCDEPPALHLNERGNLVVRSGKFKAVVPCTLDPFPDVVPEGYPVEINGSLLETFKLLAPFISDDKSRLFANTILLAGQSAYATCNTIIVERWMQTPFPITVAIPQGAVDEVIRIGEEPTLINVGDTSVTFLYSDRRWLRTQLYDAQWPSVTRMLDDPRALNARTCALSPDFFPALKKLAKFAKDDPSGNNKIIINADVGSTGDQLDDPGAAVQFACNLQGRGIFNVELLRRLESVCNELSIQEYPAACPFFHREKLVRGLIMGVRP